MRVARPASNATRVSRGSGKAAACRLPRGGRISLAFRSLAAGAATAAQRRCGCRRDYPVRRLLRRPVLVPCSLAPARIVLSLFPRSRLSGLWNACVPAREAYPGELNSAGFAWCRPVPKSLDKNTSITK
jgi:hypothetical protein